MAPNSTEPQKAESNFQNRQELQNLLRFLSQDAKIPLSQAMSKMTELGKAGLTGPESIAGSSLESLSDVFPDPKIAKQVFNAAKRISKKRAAAPDDDSSAPSKKQKSTMSRADVDPLNPLGPAEIEASLALPDPVTDEDEIVKTVLHVNRAPLVLAFAVTLLNFTMPQQPISSRLSLAQAIVSANSKSKAVSIGLQAEKTAADMEKAAEGQPIITIMGRDIRVMKRWGYEWRFQEEAATDSKQTATGDDQADTEPALWGIDLDALLKTNAPLIAGNQSANPNPNQLPVHSPHGARAYLLKSFDKRALPASEAEGSKEAQEQSGKKNKRPARATQRASDKAHNLALLLGALDILFSSWKDTLSPSDLDKRTWSWYAQVRPEVESGIAGWGGRGDVRLVDILALRRSAS